MKRCCMIRQADFPACSRLRKEVAALTAQGYEVDVICAHDGSRIPYEKSGPVTVHRIRLNRRRTGIARYLFEYGLFFCQAAVKVSFLHFRRQYRFVQVNSMPDFLVFAAAVPKLLGAKLVLDLHEPAPELFSTLLGHHHPTFIRLVAFCEQVSIRFADTVITVTDQMKENCVRRGADPSKISVILNVPALEFDRGAPELARANGNGHLSLVCHGAMLKRYGQDVAIRAVDIVRKSIPHVVLNILGYGDYESELIKLANELGLNSHVRFLGYLPFNDMMHRIATADIGIVPVEKNAYSDLVHTNKMFELIAMHKPVVISRTKAVESFFGSGCDCLKYFKPGDAGELAKCILELHQDPDAVTSMTRNAFARYQAFSWKNTQHQYCRIVESGAPKKKSVQLSWPARGQ
jgi:glycosyltransferase involved in cell wall biosynthesis